MLKKIFDFIVSLLDFFSNKVKRVWRA